MIYMHMQNFRFERREKSAAEAAERKRLLLRHM